MNPPHEASELEGGDVDEFDVADIFARLEELHHARGLSAPEAAEKAAALARGCPNYWPARAHTHGPTGRWAAGACAATPRCPALECFWY